MPLRSGVRHAGVPHRKKNGMDTLCYFVASPADCPMCVTVALFAVTACLLRVIGAPQKKCYFMGGVGQNALGIT